MRSAAGVVEPGDQVFAGGEIEFAFLVFDEGTDPFDIKRFADVEQLAACGQVEVEVGRGQGFHLPGMFLNIGDEGVVGGKDAGVFKADTCGGDLSNAIGFLGDYCRGVEGEAAESRKVQLAGLI